MSDEPAEIAGLPADVCPYCGCGMFANGKRKGQVDSFRYVVCRNQSCGRRFVSRQAPAMIVREVTPRPSSSSGQGDIKLYGEVG